jgi:hypothetical protein
LDIDDELGVLEPLPELPVLSLQPFVLLGGDRLGSALATSLSRRQACQLAPLALSPPSRQVRGIQAFSAEQGAKPSRVLAGISLSKNSLFVLGRE